MDGQKHPKKKSDYGDISQIHYQHGFMFFSSVEHSACKRVNRYRPAFRRLKDHCPAKKCQGGDTTNTAAKGYAKKKKRDIHTNAFPFGFIIQARRITISVSGYRFRTHIGQHIYIHIHLRKNQIDIYRHHAIAFPTNDADRIEYIQKSTYHPDSMFRIMAAGNGARGPGPGSIGQPDSFQPPDWTMHFIALPLASLCLPCLSWQHVNKHACCNGYQWNL